MELGRRGSAMISFRKTLGLPLFISEVSGTVDKAHCPVSLDKFLNFSEPQFITLVGVNNICLSQQWLCGLNELSMLCV